ncbi:AGAP006415-PA-like protein [Anopheles sinensis]|uniref:AGAP006415-PA-like protein n=1 Tax=Anopheles sinensis TaxID=74873 RepID=A0A084VBS3_ANOSI|nr:AGAP006415-PA-like protein [Anopheles sinensis]
MSLFLHEERRYLRGEVDRPIGESFLERDTISGVTVKFNVLLLICATLGVLSSVLVLIGLKMVRFNKPHRRPHDPSPRKRGLYGLF